MSITKLNMQMENNTVPITPLKELNLVDDFLFDVTTEDLEACKIIIELSLGITIKEIHWKEGQKVLHNLPGKRGIRLDFYVIDSENRLFNVEMQKRNEGNIPKRTRFYQGLVDAPLLKSGERSFDNLNPLFIVVICDFDLYGYEKYRYTFSNRCHEIEGLELGDASTKIILNTKGTNSDEVDQSLVDFLHYVKNSNAATLPSECDERLLHLHNKIEQIKSSEQMEVTYMKMEERDRLIHDDGVAAGMAKGIALGRTSAIQSFIEENRKELISDKDICIQIQKYFQLTPEEAENILSQN